MRTPRRILVWSIAPIILAAALLVGWRLAPSSDFSTLGEIEHPDLIECSGIIGSRRHPDVFWAHNDRGNSPTLFALSAGGKALAEFRINARNLDWEDIATDDQGRLYIGQIGNNDTTRRQIEVFRLDEPGLPVGSLRSRARLTIDRTWQLSYPADPFDSESLFIHAGHGYLISKVNRKRAASLYRFPLDSEGDTVMLEKVCELPIRSPVTGADVSPDGAHVAVVSDAGLDVFTIGGNVAALPTAPRRHFPLRKPNHVEGCCFTPAGILVASETRQLLLLPRDRFLN